MKIRNSKKKVWLLKQINDDVQNYVFCEKTGDRTCGRISELFYNTKEKMDISNIRFDREIIADEGQH